MSGVFPAFAKFVAPSTVRPSGHSTHQPVARPPDGLNGLMGGGPSTIGGVCQMCR